MILKKINGEQGKKQYTLGRRKCTRDSVRETRVVLMKEK